MGTTTVLRTEVYLCTQVKYLAPKLGFSTCTRKSQGWKFGISPFFLVFRIVPSRRFFRGVRGVNGSFNSFFSACMWPQILFFECCKANMIYWLQSVFEKKLHHSGDKIVQSVAPNGDRTTKDNALWLHPKILGCIIGVIAFFCTANWRRRSSNFDNLQNKHNTSTPMPK